MHPVIDHDVCHNIVEVAMDPRGDSQVDVQITLTMIRRSSLKFIHDRLMKNLFFFMITNCQIIIPWVCSLINNKN